MPKLARKTTKLVPEKRPRALSWKPRERAGGIYCAPACGHGCTREDYVRAREGAAALVSQLGPGWKPRVWENMGWHYQALKGRVWIGVSRDWQTGEVTGYHGAFNTVRAFGAHAKTPRALLMKLIREARTNEQRIRDDIAAVVGPAKGGKR